MISNLYSNSFSTNHCLFKHAFWVSFAKVLILHFNSVLISMRCNLHLSLNIYEDAWELQIGTQIHATSLGKGRHNIMTDILFNGFAVIILTIGLQTSPPLIQITRETMSYLFRNNLMLIMAKD